MTAGNKATIVASTVDKASGPLDRIRGKYEALQKQGAKGFAIGAGAAITTKAFSLLDGAASTVIDTLGDAVQAAIADEESVKRLSASLRANVEGWDGNTKAIEANILAKQRLGFDDETLRDSLTVLVGATHDVTKAQMIMNTAMDLARFKGIDLRTASEALIKVDGGHYRALQALGIKLRDGATQTEALAAVQKIATGQAEAYARTTSGKLVAAQIRIGEIMESFGGVILPGVVEGLDQVTTALDVLGGQIPVTDGQVARFAADVASFFTGNGLIGQAVDETVDRFDDLTKAARYMADAAKDDVVPAFETMAEALPRITEEAGKETERRMREIVKDMATSLRGGYDDVFEAATELAGAASDPLDYATRKARLTGLLTGAELQAGLHSTDPIVRAEAEALAGRIQTELATLEAAAKRYGLRTGQEYAAGLRAAYGIVSESAKAVAGAATGAFKASSPPGPESPLHHIGDWGERTAEAWADRLRSGVEAIDLEPALARVGASFRGMESRGGGQTSIATGSGGGLAPTSAPAGAGTGASGVIELHSHLHLDGRVIAEIVDRHLYYQTSGASRLPRA
ncbi:MAG: hypothetical protein EPO00_10575 [Chloroflexota bacterium]|nr:MAG: hypothetical protein EPO00_10575 [Chloroflexota bacterium]